MFDLCPMLCPHCNYEETKVVDSRESNGSTRRRRACESCSKRFTTYERAETRELLVIKRDGAREPFSREKLLRGMLRACEKRPVTLEQLESAADTIDASLRSLDTAELSSEQIGELVIEHLKQLDEVAYVRFASVYKQFCQVDDFAKEIARLRTSKVHNAKKNVAIPIPTLVMDSEVNQRGKKSISV